MADKPTPPQACEKCAHDRFQEFASANGSTFVCKKCGHEHKAGKPNKK